MSTTLEEQTENIHWITTREARAILQERTGYLPGHAVLYSAAKNGRLTSKKDVAPPEGYQGKQEARYFSKQDIEALAKDFNTKRSRYLSQDEAYELVKHRLSRADFDRLVMAQNVPPVAAIMWHQNLFMPDTLTEFATLSDEALTALLAHAEKTYTVSEAAAYLNKKLDRPKGNPVKKNTIYLKVKRGQLQPATRPANGRSTGYTFYEHSLDSLSFKRYSKTNRKQVEIIDLSKSGDMERAIKKHGDLISTKEAVKKLQVKAGHYHTANASRFISTHASPVARAGTTLYYRKKEIDELVVYPLNGKPVTQEGE